MKQLEPSAFRLSFGTNHDTDPGIKDMAEKMETEEEEASIEDARLTDVLGEAFDAFKGGDKESFIECMKSCLMR